MKTPSSTSPTAIALELELELRRAGEQLRTSRARMQGLEAEVAATLQARQAADGTFKAVSSAVSGAISLAQAVAPLGVETLPAEDLRVADEAWGLVGRLSLVHEAQVSESSGALAQVRARNRSMGGDEKALDQELMALREALLRQRST